MAKQQCFKARQGKLKRAANYHGRLPSNVEELILSQPEQVYLSTGKSQRFIFWKNENVVITEGPGTSAGNIITSYGPDGPRGESGAAIFGGSKNDPGLPISHDMIVKGEIPTPGGDTMMPGIPILK